MRYRAWVDDVDNVMNGEVPAAAVGEDHSDGRWLGVYGRWCARELEADANPLHFDGP